MTCLVTLFDRKLQVFKNLPKLTIFGIFSELLSTQNVNIARFARNVEWDILYDFQTLCLFSIGQVISSKVLTYFFSVIQFDIASFVE